jgi:integrase
MRSTGCRRGSTRRCCSPGAKGGHIGLDTWRTREWYPALDAAGIRRRGPYQLRHTFATEALAAGVSIFELARVMGASVKTIDRHYGHLARDSEQAIRARLDARAARSGVVVASDPDD